MLAPGHSHAIAPLFRLKFSASGPNNTVQNKQVAFFEDSAFGKTLAETIEDRSFY
jgi:hypothetical protein